jgi:hypothetical protein
MIPAENVMDEELHLKFYLNKFFNFLLVIILLEIRIYQKVNLAFFQQSLYLITSLRIRDLHQSDAQKQAHGQLILLSSEDNSKSHFL